MSVSHYVRLSIVFTASCVFSILAVFRLFFSFIKSPLTFGWKKRLDIPACLKDPSLGTHGFLHLENVRLHYVSAGDEGKPLMLFVHGFPEFWYSWRYQLREFKKDYRVVAIDQRGYSESDKPSGVSNYRITELCKDIKQVIHALGYKSCVLVGHDWGGAVTWSVASLYPEVVDKLIVMNCPHPGAFRKYLMTHRSQMAKSWYMFFFQMPFIPELSVCVQDKKMLENAFCGPEMGLKVNKLTPEDMEAYKYAFPTLGSVTGPINYYRASMRGQPLRSGPITATCLLIWGCQDGALEKPLADESLKCVESLTVKYIEESSHWVQMDCPQLVNQYMREFLK